MQFNMITDSTEDIITFNKYISTNFFDCVVVILGIKNPSEFNLFEGFSFYNLFYR